MHGLISLFDFGPSEMQAVCPFDDFCVPSESRHNGHCFLVESANELLMIFKLQQRMEVFKVDNDRSAPEPVKGIGNRAIFLCYRQCLSVNADKFHSVEANCIYYLKSVDFHTFPSASMILRMRKKRASLEP
uniref:KIB1-4 beta-propeller domain-containing protein n=1 Tax=Triticum urartu TaxID=4572 RepID=A0A8R7U142_TRIUA